MTDKERAREIAERVNAIDAYTYATPLALEDIRFLLAALAAVREEGRKALVTEQAKNRRLMEAAKLLRHF